MLLNSKTGPLFVVGLFFLVGLAFPLLYFRPLPSDSYVGRAEAS
jgi:hypothetical protein